MRDRYTVNYWHARFMHYAYLLSARADRAASRVGGCGEGPTSASITLQGQILVVAPDHKQATIKHEEIKGFMAAMTMPYKVQRREAARRHRPGRSDQRTLVVVSNDAYLTDVKKVGEAPLEGARRQPSRAAGLVRLRAAEAGRGGAGRDVRRSGRQEARRSRRSRDRRSLVTFIYTKCPMPTFCPLMDRHFAAVQKTLKDDPALKDVHLVSVSFDPVTDTPPVLKKHASEARAPTRRAGRFSPATATTIDQFAARFGVSVARALNDPRDITHNLRTAIVDADGKLVKVYTGNEWTPDQVARRSRSRCPQVASRSRG